MKKSTMNFVAEFLTKYAANPSAELVSDELIAARDELTAEIARDAAKAQANRDLYEVARAIVIAALPTGDEGVTVSALYSTIENDLPEGFSRGKVQYGLLNMWSDDVIVHEQPKGANTYSRR